MSSAAELYERIPTLRVRRGGRVRIINARDFDPARDEQIETIAQRQDEQQHHEAGPRKRSSTRSNL